MAKNKNKIVEAPEVVINKEPEVTEIVLVIDIAFTDKHTGADYKVKDEVVFEKERAEELLADYRKLVHKK